MSSSVYGFRKLSQIKIGTFNVHGLSSHYKQVRITEDMIKYELDILCLQATKIREEKTWIDKGYQFIMARDCHFSYSIVSVNPSVEMILNMEMVWGYFKSSTESS